MYWHQGFNDTPPVIEPCVNQWKNLHPDWDIEFLDKDTIYDYAEPLPIKKETLDRMVLPHQSDLLRTQLLIKHGGVWADPTTFPLIPLEDWILDKMDAGYFFFYKPGRDRVIANWFIATEKGNKTLDALYHSLISYWNKSNFRNTDNPKRDDVIQLNRFINRNLYMPKLWFTPIFTKILRLCTYMVYHHMFYHLISSRKDLKEVFELMPKIKADLPLSFKKEIINDPLLPELKAVVDQKKAYMIKLNWRKVNDLIPPGSNLDYLFQQSISYGKKTT